MSTSTPLRTGLIPLPSLWGVDDYLSDLFSLQGRRALVTGGSSGIGYAIAEALGRAGAQVHLVARHVDRLERSVGQLVERGVHASATAADLGDSSQVAELAGFDVVSGCDVLVNCAGVNHRPRLEETSPRVLEETLAVNLLAPYHLGQAAGPRMAERGFGRIINVGSQQSWSAFGNSGAYGMAKAGIGGLTRSQAEAWGSRGVTANALVPGFMVTAMTEAMAAEPGREEALAARSLLGRNGRPSDVVTATLFLASPASCYVTGVMLPVDGGFAVH